ncbi:hypothetical protein GCM10018789_12610 [Streptomyces werraensis]|nr:hypothetical protein GCM10018789_12610 [Streptomyces werraensis]
MCPGYPLVRLLRVVRRHPKGPGKSIDVVRRPVLLRVCRGPFFPPVVMDHDFLLMFSRTPGRIRKLLRNVRGILASLVGPVRACRD